jgi:hypothetical protein
VDLYINSSIDSQYNISYILRQDYGDDQMKEGEIGMAFSTHGRDEKFIRDFGEG